MINKEQSIELIKECLEDVSPGSADLVTVESNLMEDGILDSLDAMTFIFKLEKKIGFKLKSITEDTADLSMVSLVKELSEQS